MQHATHSVLMPVSSIVNNNDDDDDDDEDDDDDGNQLELAENMLHYVVAFTFG